MLIKLGCCEWDIVLLVVVVLSGVLLVGSNIMVDGGIEMIRRVGSDVIVNMCG